MAMINFDAFKGVLPLIGQGLLGVFLVIGVLAVSVFLLNQFTGKKKE